MTHQLEPLPLLGDPLPDVVEAAARIAIDSLEAETGRFTDTERTLAGALILNTYRLDQAAERINHLTVVFDTLAAAVASISATINDTALGDHLSTLAAQVRAASITTQNGDHL